jgi:hypothetical protein
MFIEPVGTANEESDAFEFAFKANCVFDHPRVTRSRSLVMPTLESYYIVPNACVLVTPITTLFFEKSL